MTEGNIMFFILTKNEKYYKVLDSSDGIVEDISKAKFEFIKNKIKWQDVSDLDSLTQGGSYKTALFTLLKSNIDEFIISIPDYMSFSLEHVIKTGQFISKYTYLIEKRAKNDWSYMINGQSKSYRSGLSDEEIRQVIGVCSPYTLHWEKR